MISDITAIPAPNHSFDAILCSEVLEHVPEPTHALDEFARAVTFMAGAAGANWKDPDAAMLDRLKAAEQKKLDKAKAKK